MARFLVNRPLKTCVLLAAIFTVRFCTGANVTMVWDPSPSTNVAAYRIYYGTASRVYSTYAQVAAPTTNVVISNLVAGTTYYFGAKAVDPAGSESAFSNEATYVPPMATTTNTAPTINAPAGIILPQNAGPQSVQLTGISSGSPSETQTLSVTATSIGIVSAPVVSYASPSSTGVVTFTPQANATGWAQVFLSVNDGSSVNNITTNKFWIFVNNPPTVNAISNMAINEDAGTQTVTVSGITAGAANETNQVVQVLASSSNPALIPAPTVTYVNPNTTATLKFAPVANAYGTATITVTVKDDQYGNNTTTRTFTVTVNPVNDPPTLNAISSVTVDPSVGPKTVSLSGISSGAANENQMITITAQSSNPTLVPTPTVSYVSPNSTGSLTLTAASGQTGSATVTVTVSDGLATISRAFAVSVVSLPKISNLTASSPDPRTLNVAWTTDRTATCYVEYGTNAMVNMMSAQTSGTSHSVTLTNLDAGTLYYLRVTATANGGTATQVATASTEAADIVAVPAETGTLVGSFKIYSNTAAQDGQYIAASSFNNANASFNLNLQLQSNYRIWARIKTAAGGASFGVLVDGVERTLFAGDSGAVNQFHWVLLTDNANRTNAAVYALNAGTHSLVMRGASGVWLDELVVLNDPVWQPILPTVGPTLAATRTSTSTATLSWTDPSSNETAYSIEYSTDGINFSFFTNLAAPASSLNIGNLSAQTYYFRMISYNSVDRSAYSNVATMQ